MNKIKEFALRCGKNLAKEKAKEIDSKIIDKIISGELK